MEQSDRECCWIFIDNSNLIIEGWKYYARKNKLIPAIKQDKRMRLDTGKLVGHIAPEAECKAYLYGSEPPALDTIWRAIEEQDIEVRKFQKSFRGKEKEVDTALSFDAGIAANENREKGGTFVFISGDRDYKYCVERVLECGFQTKDIHGSLNPIPAERTIIIQFCKSPNNQTKKQIVTKKEVEEVTRRLGIPFYYHWTWGSRADKEDAAKKKTAGNIVSEENDGKRQLLIIFGLPESSDLTEDDIDELTLQCKFH
uniref:NYN domain-containing protein n=1 Tax=Plectus sambesii TaxID=2011161 RepID=A0A914VSB9_9BILA